MITNEAPRVDDQFHSTLIAFGNLLMRHPKSQLCKTLFFATTIAISAACSVTVYDEDTAAEKAVIFARTAFIERNAEAAYELLHEKTKENLNVQKLRGSLNLMHPRGWPRSLSKKGYEIIPGRNALNIYIDGRNGDENFHYRLEVHQSENGTYKVWSFFRGQGEYPKSDLYREFKDPMHQRTG